MNMGIKQATPNVRFAQGVFVLSVLCAVFAGADAANAVGRMGAGSLALAMVHKPSA